MRLASRLPSQFLSAAKVACSLCVLFAAAELPATQGDEVSFDVEIGEWRVVGDPRVGSCLVLRPITNGTQFSIGAMQSEQDIRFALSNPAWASLGDGPLRLNATFHNASGDVTDLWKLDAISTSVDNGGPRINFQILRAKNDGASFVRQLQKANSVRFWRGTVPVAAIDLTGSAQMFDTLMRCRAYLRSDENFDPFAQ
jgi:hypothetical protein